MIIFKISIIFTLSVSGEGLISPLAQFIKNDKFFKNLLYSNLFVSAKA